MRLSDLGAEEVTAVDGPALRLSDLHPNDVQAVQDDERFPGEPEDASRHLSAPLPPSEGIAGMGKRVAKDYLLPALEYAADKTERYSAAPGRAAVDTLAKQGTIFDAADSFRRQFGEDPNKAPTRLDLAANVGVTDTTPMSERFPSLYTNAKNFSEKGLKLSKGGPLDFSPAGAVGEVAGFASDPMSYFSPKGVVDSVRKGFAPVSRAGNRVANNVLFSVPGDVTDRYLTNPDIVRAAKGLPEIGDRVADAANAVTGDIRAGSAKAAAARGANGATIPKQSLLDAFDRRLSDPTLTRSEKAALSQRRAEVDALGGTLTDDEVYKEIRELDELADWDSPLPKKAQGIVNSTRHDVRDILGIHNPVFDAQQKEVAKRMAVRNKIAEKFGLARGDASDLIATDRTASSLRDIGRANKVDRQEALGQLKDLGYDDIVPEVQASLDKSTLSTGNTNGSRRTMAGSAVGAGAGYLVGGPLGATVGAPIGAAAGATVDRYAGRIARGSMDAQMAMGRGASAVAGKAGLVPKGLAANTALSRSEGIIEQAQSRPESARFAPILKNAAQRGDQAVKTTHFMLMQTEPDYRQAMQSKEDEQQ